MMVSNFGLSGANIIRGKITQESAK